MAKKSKKRDSGWDHFPYVHGEGYYLGDGVYFDPDDERTNRELYGDIFGDDPYADEKVNAWYKTDEEVEECDKVIGEIVRDLLKHKSDGEEKEREEEKQGE